MPKELSSSKNGFQDWGDRRATNAAGFHFKMLIYFFFPPSSPPPSTPTILSVLYNQGIKISVNKKKFLFLLGEYSSLSQGFKSNFGLTSHCLSSTVEQNVWFCQTCRDLPLANLTLLYLRLCITKVHENQEQFSLVWLVIKILSWKALKNINPGVTDTFFYEGQDFMDL